MGVTDVCQLGLTKSYQVNQLFTRLTVRENLVIAALASCAASSGSICCAPARVPGLDEQVEQHARARRSDRARRHTGLGARLWREAAARDRPGARHLAEPAAARRAAGRHEPARARRDGEAAEVDRQGRTMIIIDHDMDSLFELAGAHHRAAGRRVLAEGTPARSSNPVVQEAYLGGVHSAGMSLLEVEGLNSYYGDSPHPVRRVAARGAQRGRGAARPQRRRQEHDAEEPDGRGDAALRLDRVRRAEDRRQKSHAIARAACSWSTRTGASSAA
jgi:hypothetical protein